MSLHKGRTGPEPQHKNLVRCPALLDGEPCNAVLWAAFDAHIEVRVRVRQREFVEIRAEGPVLTAMSVRCVRCGARCWPASPDQSDSRWYQRRRDPGRRPARPAGGTSPLEQILARRAAESSEGLVYVEGGWVDRVPTVPVDAGVAAVVRFARSCWERNLSLRPAPNTRARYSGQYQHENRRQS